MPVVDCGAISVEMSGSCLRTGIPNAEGDGPPSPPMTDVEEEGAAVLPEWRPRTRDRRLAYSCDGIELNIMNCVHRGCLGREGWAIVVNVN